MLPKSSLGEDQALTVSPQRTWWTQGQQCQLLFVPVLNTENFHAPSLLGILGTQHMLDAPLLQSLM